MIYKNLTELIGRTPLLEVPGGAARILLKLELFNPGGSVKDRIALSMIEDAEKRGVLKKGATLIEPTSGNTGVGLAWVGTARGYKVILTMPDTMSLERRSLLKALGAKLVLTPGSEGMKGAIAKAEEIHKETPGSIIPGQFVNPANPAAHVATTGPEIWDETEGQVDIFVGGVGTGGTVSGVGQSLKARKPSVKVVAVEPASSAVLSGNPSGKHKIQGIGAGFVPDTYDSSVVDRVLPITDEEAVRASRRLAREQGLLVGISSGASYAAALKLAAMEENAGKTIVALLPDTGERYLSTVLYAFEEYPV
ncbi:MAG: cysteine synthase A [Bacteroidales bacterium]|nr:cysteine synthase A [Bacteroidales bacterium]MBQ4288272.1 cysteine synthase A [Bacteroidales bacterium]